MKILYIHGYNGHEDGMTAQMIRNARPNDTVCAPAIDYTHPLDACRQIVDAVNIYRPDAIVASSLGAFCVLHEDFGVCSVLINTALPKDMMKIVSDKSMLAELDEMLYDILSNYDRPRNEFVYFVFGDNDVVANNREYLKSLFSSDGYDHTYVKEMGHALSKECVTHELNHILNEIAFSAHVFGNERDFL